MNLRAIIPVCLIVVAGFVPADLFAGRQEGIMVEFRRIEEAIRNAQKTPEARQRTLEANLDRAVRLAIKRRFHEKRDEILKDLTAETMLYENPTSELVYYVKYRTYVVRFDFSRNPEMYIQAPVYEKFLIIGGEQINHTEGEPAPAGDGQ
jgi:hypothetical protein